MRIVLTGATGFIGINLTSEFLKRGYTVIAHSRSDWENTTFDHPNLIKIAGPLDATTVDQAAKFKPDTCVHSAWITTPGEYTTSPENDQLVKASLQFLTELEGNGVSRFLVMGSCLEYDHSFQKPLKEDSPVNPKSNYTKAKNQLHQLLEESFNENTTLCWARLFYPYGIGEHTGKLISSLISRAVNGEKSHLNSPDKVVDYINVNDAATAIATCLENNINEVINIGSGQGVKLRYIVHIIEEAMHVTLQEFAPQKSTGNTNSEVIADISKLRSLGWKPGTDIKSGILKMIEAR